MAAIGRDLDAGLPDWGWPLLEGGCEIWVASVREFSEHQAVLDGLLTVEERGYVHRVREGAATARLSRGLLRLVLAHYLNRPPTEIDIDRSCSQCERPHGRPRLRRQPDAATELIGFSVTHGGDMLVLAFTAGAPVGVDVEPIGALNDLSAELLDFTLTVSERLRLLEVPLTEQKQMFLRHWTAKEAVLKALGTGLDLDPQTVTIDLSPPHDRASAFLPGSTSVQLRITDVEVGPRHVCTLATGEQVRELRTSRLSPGFVLGASAESWPR